MQTFFWTNFRKYAAIIRICSNRICIWTSKLIGSWVLTTVHMQCKLWSDPFSKMPDDVCSYFTLFYSRTCSCKQMEWVFNLKWSFWMPTTTHLKMSYTIWPHLLPGLQFHRPTEIHGGDTSSRINLFFWSTGLKTNTKHIKPSTIHHPTSKNTPFMLILIVYVHLSRWHFSWTGKSQPGDIGDIMDADIFGVGVVASSWRSWWLNSEASYGCHCWIHSKKIDLRI